MRYIKPRPLSDPATPGFHMTCLHNDRVYPIGYCAPKPTKEGLATVCHADLIEEEWKRIEPHLDKYHEHPHATAEEAAACYRQYLLDMHIRRYSEKGTAHRCFECRDWTEHRVQLNHGTTILPLCEAHATREFVDKYAPQFSEYVAS